MKDSGSHLNLSSSSIINWNNIIKKEARSITDDMYLGSIQGLYEPFIVVEEKGVLNQKRYFIPKDLLKGIYLTLHFGPKAMHSAFFMVLHLLVKLARFYPILLSIS
jgi:hypothetical protein